MDGSLGSRTAAMLAPFADDPANSGLPQYEQDKLNALTQERLQAGFQIGFHAIGDRAVDMALTAFAEALKATKSPAKPDYRLRIEHAKSSPQPIRSSQGYEGHRLHAPSHVLTDMGLGPSPPGRKARRTFLRLGRNV